ncbi:hypothetical protein [Halalkalibacter akibai]|uniref:Uncharacterized protein n=1 Tax=Halalkalibacter akibai (strain ATCC 43226 / DSM 21942 / CIP 109018 / JCM 9157 / 1139) TaxID=1236973 RepID=W4QQJ6_HALA3|nr:hypothetical protein [Halalkalibacter akibai]GAE34380.1 hypothetical protein JCM9157_1432 [Halalkalibacter akibai JCM 9157]
MTFEKGAEFKIAQVVKGHFNSAETLTIIREFGNTVQFTLGNGKGHGSMPIEHMKYLINKNELTVNKRSLLANETAEEKLG